MPHLMNCGHSEDGWCLSCVGELWDNDNNKDGLLQQIKTDTDYAIEQIEMAKSKQLWLGDCLERATDALKRIQDAIKEKETTNEET